MGEFKEPQPGKRFLGCILRSSDDPTEALTALGGEFGPVDCMSDALPFSSTDYYSKEMGASLVRQFFSFEPLAPADALVEMRHLTQSLEEEFRIEGNRRFNLDPGLLFADQVVIATTKNYAHKIYLGRGVYGDLTYLFRERAYHPLPWTFPDLRLDNRLDFFRKVREIYMRQRRRTTEPREEQAVQRHGKTRPTGIT